MLIHVQITGHPHRRQTSPAWAIIPTYCAFDDLRVTTYGHVS